MVRQARPPRAARDHYDRRRTGPARPPLLRHLVLAPDGPVRDGRRHRRHRAEPALRDDGTALPRPRLLPRRRRVRLCVAGGRAVRHRFQQPVRPRAPAGPRLRACERARRRGGRPVQPHLGPAARHVPGHRHPRPGLPRPSHDAQRPARDRRLQRPFRTAAGHPRLLLHRHLPRRARRPRRPLRRTGASVVRRPGPGGRGLARRPKHPAWTPRPRPRRRTRQRGRRRRDGSPSHPLPRLRIHRVLDVRGCRGRPAGPGVQARRSRSLRPAAVHRLPRDDRHRRPRLGGRRGLRRGLRRPDPAPAHQVRRRPAPAHRSRHHGIRPVPGRRGPLPLRHRDRPRSDLRPRRPGRTGSQTAAPQGRRLPRTRRFPLRTRTAPKEHTP